MSENQAMSDERLEDLRRDVMSQVASAGGRTRHSDAYAEMLDEIDRLRAENERLITVAVLAEEHISAQGTRRFDKTRGGRLLSIIDEALGRTPVSEEK